MALKPSKFDANGHVREAIMFLLGATKYRSVQFIRATAPNEMTARIVGCEGGVYEITIRCIREPT